MNSLTGLPYRIAHGEDRLDLSDTSYEDRLWDLAKHLLASTEVGLDALDQPQWISILELR